ncbi:hypothetical protein WJX73_010706 [Symbiochloris irregularis]|uniref:Magnesium transporter n=1 Tax=Symbiochloris irregularis TaxID=706552 RepID=A0AAW1NRT6_9CHLO
MGKRNGDEHQPLLSGRTEYGSQRNIFEEYQNVTQAQASPQVSQHREWLHLDQTGNVSFLTVDKHAIITELGIHYRDLRFVDPMVTTPYPTAIFIRDRALVVNMESVKMIITEDQVFVITTPQEGKPLTVSIPPSAQNFFVCELLSRINPSTGLNTGTNTPRRFQHGRSMTGIDRRMPFELRALEAGLQVAVRLLEAEVGAVEQATLPALKRLMVKVSRVELDNVRYAKIAVNKLLTRVKTFKKELEDILDDDEDMRDMYLGRREQQRQRGHADTEGADSDAESVEGDGHHQHHSGASPLGRHHHHAQQDWQDRFPGDPMAEHAHSPSSEGGHHAGHTVLPAAMSAPAPHAPMAIPRPDSQAPSSRAPDTTLQPAPSAPASEFPSALHDRQKSKAHAKGKAAWTKHVQKIASMLALQQPSGAEDPNDISGAESMLENYFMLVDSLLSRLLSLEERIDGCEDQLNIELDHRRNELVALDLIITAFMAMFAFVSMIGGVFGMNMKNGFEESQVAFWSTTGVTLALASALMMAIVVFARQKRLLFIPDANSMRR